MFYVFILSIDKINILGKAIILDILIKVISYALQF